MGWVGSRKTGISAGRVGSGWVTISVGRVGSQNLDRRATVGRPIDRTGRSWVQTSGLWPMIQGVSQVKSSMRTFLAFAISFRYDQHRRLYH